MDFFARQDRALRSSRRLLVLFAAAVLSVLAGVNGAAALLWQLAMPGAGLPPYFLATNSFVVLLFVGGNAWLESLRLRDGGAAIAHRLGARSPRDDDPAHRRLVNVVEEVAIAAGSAVPEVFVLDDDAINALTAGAHDVAIVVTRGALAGLDRDELQAVVAHEIAHVLEGDVRLNTRLAGALYGLCSLSVLGRSLLRASMRLPAGRRGLPLPAPLLAGTGFVLAGVGWLGSLAAHLVQAGISRQRELLADARSIQLTRNGDALGRALRKASGQAQHRLASEYAEVIAHMMLFGIETAHAWFDTHPTLAARTRAIYGRPMPPIRVGESVAGPGRPDPTAGTDRVAHGTAVAAGGATRADALGQVILDAIPFVPAPTAGVPDGSVAMSGVSALVPGAASRWLDTMTDSANHAAVLIDAARRLSPDPLQSRRLLCALVASPVAVGAARTPVPARAGADPAHPFNAAVEWLATPAALWLRVSLIEILCARLRPWPRPVREALLEAARRAVAADGRIEKTEWVYYTLVRHRLLPSQRPVRRPNDRAQGRALSAVFAMAGHLAEQSARRTRDALAAAATELGLTPPATTPDAVTDGELAVALDTLAAMPPLAKPQLLREFAALARDAGDPVYQAFLAALGAAIDCPAPRAGPRRAWSGLAAR